MSKHALRDKQSLKDNVLKRETRENLDWYKEKEVESPKTYEMTSREWFDWFVTTDEYKELIKEISQDSKTPIIQTPHSAGESGSNKN